MEVCKSFRAKLKNNNEIWVYGGYVEHPETTHCYIGPEQEVTVHHLIIASVMTDWELPNRLEAYDIDPDTLCRGTGLKDKNGLPLWEHDLVKVDGIESLAEIRYGEYKHISAQREYPNGDYGFYLFWKDDKTRSMYRNDILYFLDKCQVVGTKYDGEAGKH